MNKKSTHLRIHPSAIYQLGESLITDEIQALIELVKNSYDADATYTKISINTINVTEILIEDNGIGMSGKDIIRGWLNVSNRNKSNQKYKKITTKRGRTPLGDKGLGRLGVQKLGWDLQLLTESKNNPKYEININWKDFLTAKKFKKVPIYPIIHQKTNKTGTILKITNLREAYVWNSKEAQERLIQEFSKMISPYEKIRDFSIFLEINKQKKSLFSVSEELRETSHIKYFIDFKDSELTITGKVKNDWFKSKIQKEDKLRFDNDVNYNSFFDYISDFPIFKQYNFQMDNETFDINFKYKINIDDLDGTSYIEESLFNKKEIANPGNFSSEIDYFDLNEREYNTVYTKQQEYREAVKAIGGIRVFRDSFGVRTEDDWLKLGKGSTSKTYYSLRPENTHGYIAISSEHNSQLEETTSREKFKDTPYYRNFYLLLREFVDLSDKVNAFLGKKWIEFRNKEKEKLIELDLGETNSVSNVIRRSISKITKHKEDIKDFKEAINFDIDDSIGIVTKIIEKNKNKNEINNSDKDNLLSMIEKLQNLINKSENLLPELNNQINELEKLQEYANIVDERFRTTREQLADVFETASLGLVAETISHEIHNVTDQVILKSKQIKSHIRNNDLALLTYNEYIISTSLSLKKQISYLDPALKYIREKKEIIDIGNFLETFTKGQNDILQKSRITIDFKSNSNFKIKFNEGKLLQVLINMIVNSEYWINNDSPSERKIFIKQEKNNIYFWDSANGVHPSVELILFEPFVSFKYDTVNRTKGRGLGLYIIKQILEYSNCSIELVNEKNNFDRFYKFKINFNGVLCE